MFHGPELVRIVRSPGVFSLPDISIIMLTAHSERWRALEVAGINASLCKLVSIVLLLDCLLLPVERAALAR